MSLSTNTTYRVVLDKLGGSDPSVFVGNEGELFYDPSSTGLKLSDGTTSGGVSISVSSVSNGISTITTDTTGVTPLTTKAFKVSGSLIPDTNVTYDLGTAEHKWRDIYLDSATIHTSDGNISTTDGVLSFDGQPVVLVSQLQSMISSATSFEDFKNAIMGLS